MGVLDDGTVMGVPEKFMCIFLQVLRFIAIRRSSMIVWTMQM